MGREAREELRRAFGVTSRMVDKALHNDSDSDLAKRIRSLAMQKGGVLMAAAPLCETFFDADGVIRQYFPNGALLSLSKADGGCELWFDGRLVDRWDRVLLSDLEGIQERAESLK